MADKRSAQEIANDILTVPLQSEELIRGINVSCISRFGVEMDALVKEHQDDSLDSQYESFGDYRFVEKATQLLAVLRGLQSGKKQLSQPEREVLRKSFEVLDGALHTQERVIRNAKHWSEHPEDDPIMILVDQRALGAERAEEYLQNSSHAAANNYNTLSDLAENMEVKLVPLFRELASVLNIELMPRRSGQEL